MSGVAFRGVSADQDTRFHNKEKMLLKSMSKSFPQEFSVKVDLTRVNWEVMNPWISNRLTELLGGVEDDVLIGFVHGQFEGKKQIDPRMLQINLTGFLEKNTSLFCKELWNLLISANQTSSGVPQQLLDKKAAELRKHEEERERTYQNISRERSRHEEFRRYDDSRHHRRDTRDRDYNDADSEYRRRRVSPPRRDRRDARRRSRSRDQRSRSRERYRRQRSRSPPRSRERRHRSRSRERVKGYRNDTSGQRTRRRSRSRSPADGRIKREERTHIKDEGMVDDKLKVNRAVDADVKNEAEEETAV